MHDTAVGLQYAGIFHKRPWQTHAGTGENARAHIQRPAVTWAPRTTIHPTTRRLHLKRTRRTPRETFHQRCTRRGADRNSGREQTPLTYVRGTYILTWNPRNLHALGRPRPAPARGHRTAWQQLSETRETNPPVTEPGTAMGPPNDWTRHARKCPWILRRTFRRRQTPAEPLQVVQRTRNGRSIAPRTQATTRRPSEGAVYQRATLSKSRSIRNKSWTQPVTTHRR